MIDGDDARMLISDDYREQNRLLHEQNMHYGVSSSRWVKLVYDFYRNEKLQIKSILDYGAGKKMLEKGLLAINNTVPIRSYDPCIPSLAKRPKPADLVVCTDVLEHIEPEFLNNVLDDLRELTLKLILMTIATRPAVKFLPDGRNAHLIQESFPWWHKRLIGRFNILKVKEDPGELLIMAQPLPDES